MNIINKDEAILWFSMQIGNADGEWSNEEMQDTIAFGNIDKKNLDINLFFKKVENGEINSQIAIDYLLSLDYEDKIDCMVTCYAVAMADGEIKQDEFKYLINLLLILEIDIAEVQNIYINNFLNKQHVKNYFKSKEFNQKYGKNETVKIWLNTNKDKFSSEQIKLITSQLEKLKAEQINFINSIKLVEPNQIVIFAWLLGIDGFFINQVGRSIIKIVLAFTFIGALFFIIDAFGAKKRAQEYNFNLIQNAITKY